MAFMIRDFASITASMINWMRASTSKIKDYNVGSAARTLVEAPAIELDQLYQEMMHGLREAIPVSTYQTFDFALQGEAPAAGALTFFTTGAQTSSILIEAGTKASNPGTGVVYETTADLTIPVGAESGTAPAQATTAGAVTNADAGAINELEANIDGVVGVENLSRFVSGRDEETPEQRKLRFAAYVSTLQRGTLAALRYGAGSASLQDEFGAIVERVRGVNIIEPYEDDPDNEAPGFIEIYVHNGVGGTSSQLVNRVQRNIDGYYDDNNDPVPGWKAAGAIVNVYAATEVDTAVEGSVSIRSGYQVSDILERAIEEVSTYIIGLQVGDPVIRNEIIELIMAIEGVYDVSLAEPSANVSIERSEKAMPGTIDLVAA